MAASPNFWSVYDKLLDAESELSEGVPRLVEAALAGPKALDAVMSGRTLPEPDPGERPEGSRPRPPEAFLTRIAVEGFRGVGPRAQLDLTPGPGLTLVVGRNGSGKSSFAEGLEFVLTGDTLRWSGRKPVKEWRSGWRNLHHEGPVHLEATLTVEGEKQPVTVARHWTASAELSGEELAVRKGTTASGIEALGWVEALTTSRPFLSYNELGQALDGGPSKLADALLGLLGLEDVADARRALTDAKKARDKAIAEARKRAQSLVPLLERSDDPRAQVCLEAMGKRTPDFEALTDAVLGEAGVDPDAELGVLRRLVDVAGPDAEEVLKAADELRNAVDAQASLAETAAGADLEVAKLLEQAVGWQEGAGALDCPVCETPGVLGPQWREGAKARAAALRSSAGEVSAATRRVASAVDRAKQTVRRVPMPVEHELSEEARAAREAWGVLPEGPAALAAHLEGTFDRVQETFEGMREQARARLDALQDSWRPLQKELAGWLDQASDAFAEKERIGLLKEAEGWMKQVEEDLRAERFQPVADRAKETWTRLRQQSNVDLAGIVLAGTQTSRRVELDVTVDGRKGVALGVMSQGELHALALSLFLPRLLREDSPFRFLVIDDPVQAMDPAKVDGLARVLEDAAKTHQVVVFTHDARLPEATRRLGIGCRVVEVRRRADSQVTVKVTGRPADQYIQDAFHVEEQSDKLGDEITRRVVPGLCRLAVEAACKERAWFDLLKSGMTHAQVEEEIAQCNGLHPLATLALFGDRNRGAELLPRLSSSGRWVTDTFQAVKKHAHEPLPKGADCRAFILDVQKLAKGFRP